MYLLNPSTMVRMWHKVNFWAEYNWFELRVFPFLVKDKEFNLPDYFSDWFYQKS